jgi:hypothetical protein
MTPSDNFPSLQRIALPISDSHDSTGDGAFARTQRSASQLVKSVIVSTILESVSFGFGRGLFFLFQTRQVREHVPTTRSCP